MNQVKRRIIVTDSRLIIMRHAKSDWTSGTTADFDRPLSKRGKREGQGMGRYLAEQQLVPERIISSPALRARQTTELVADEIGITTDEIIWLEKIYAALLKDLLSVIEAYAENLCSLMLVGHNPGLDELLCFLARERAVPTSKGKLMTTSSIAILNYGAARISTKPRSASLELLIRPKELDIAKL
jgi:phosphohistidine phosphatase